MSSIFRTLKGGAVPLGFFLAVLLLLGFPVATLEARDGTPRLFLTPDSLAKLKAKVAANDATWLALKQRADLLATYAVPPYDRSAWRKNSIGYAYQGESWLEAAEVLGLAWKVTADTRYADKLVELADVIIAAPLACIKNDSGYPTRAVPVAAALIYDWLYNYPALNQNGRKAALISQVNSWFDWYRLKAYEKDGPALSNYFGGHILGFGLAGMAMDEDNNRSDGIKLLQCMKDKWDATVGVDFAPGGKLSGGWPNQGFNYGPTHFVRLLKFASAYRSYKEITTGVGVDLMPNLDGMALNHIYNLMPNRWQTTDEGDWPTRYRGIMSAALPDILTTMLGGPLRDQMAFFVNNLATPPAGERPRPDLFVEALFKDTVGKRSDYRTVQPTTYRSLPDQHLYVRSDWSDDAVWSSYNGGSWNWPDHQVKAAGHVALARGADYLLVNASQWKGTSGLSGLPNVNRQMGDGANTLYWDDGGAYNYNKGNYVGGQGLWGSNTNLRYESGAGYVYSKCDHTSAYDISRGAQNPSKRTLRYFHRNYVNLGGTTIVLYDRIGAKSDSYSKELRFHLNKESSNTASEAQAQSTLGNSRLFIKAVSEGSLTLDRSDIASALPRVRIVPPAPTTEWHPLTVIFVGSSTSSMPSTHSIDSANMSGVVIHEATPRIVLFAKDGTPQHSVAYESPYAAETVGNHLIVDLAPGKYDVYVDGRKRLAGLSASTQGVLSFAVTGGTRYRVAEAE